MRAPQHEALADPRGLHRNREPFRIGAAGARRQRQLGARGKAAARRLAQPLLELGWIEERGYGYAPTPRGHAAHEDPSLRVFELPTHPSYGPLFVDRDPPYRPPPAVAVTNRGLLSPSYTEQRPNSLPWVAMLVEDAYRAVWPLVVLVVVLVLLGSL